LPCLQVSLEAAHPRDSGRFFFAFGSSKSEVIPCCDFCGKIWGFVYSLTRPREQDETDIHSLCSDSGICNCASAGQSEPYMAAIALSNAARMNWRIQIPPQERIMDLQRFNFEHCVQRPHTKCIIGQLEPFRYVQ
jgi:hypothetical protein